MSEERTRRERHSSRPWYQSGWMFAIIPVVVWLALIVPVTMTAEPPPDTEPITKSTYENEVTMITARWFENDPVCILEPSWEDTSTAQAQIFLYKYQVNDLGEEMGDELIWCWLPDDELFSQYAWDDLGDEWGTYYIVEDLTTSKRFRQDMFPPAQLVLGEGGAS